MGYKLVIDPVTKEETYKWVEKTQSQLEERRAKQREIEASTPESEPFDPVGAVKTVPRMFVNAGINAVQEGSDTVRDLAALTPWVDESVATSGDNPNKAILGLGDWKPEKLESSGALEDFGTGVLQFGLEWFMLSKALRAVNWGLKGTGVGKGIAKVTAKGKQLETAAATAARKIPVVGKVAAPITAAGVNATINPKGLIIDFAGYDQYEGRLYDLAANTSAFQWIEENSNPQVQDLLNQLKSNPNDSALKGRLKNAIEGWGIDFGVGSTASIVRLLLGKWSIENLSKTVPGSPEFYDAIEQVKRIETANAKDPNIRDARVQTRIDRAQFDKSFANQTKEWRDQKWEEVRYQLGKRIQEQPRFVHATTKDAIENIQKTGIRHSPNGAYGPGVYAGSKDSNVESWVWQRHYDKNKAASLTRQFPDEDFVDLGDYPLGKDTAARAKQQALRIKAGNLRRQGKNIVIRNHPKWGDLQVVDQDYVNRAFGFPERSQQKPVRFSDIKEAPPRKRISPDDEMNELLKKQEALGTEPTKPESFYETVDGKRKMTAEGKAYKKWIRDNNKIKKRLEELGTAEKQILDDPNVRVGDEGALLKEETETAFSESTIDPDRLFEEGFSWKGEKGWVDPDGNPVTPQQVKEIEEAQEAFTARVQELAIALEKGDIPYFRTKTTRRKKGINLNTGRNIYERTQKIIKDDEIEAAFLEGKSISQIIDSLEGNNPRGAGLGEGRISMRHHKGVEQIKKQMRREVQRDLEVEDVKAIEKFIDMIGEDMFDDVTLSFFNKIRPEGRFAFGRNLLEINTDITRDGDFKRTMIHELWHTLSRFLPEADLKAYKKEFIRAQARYIEKADKDLLKLRKEVADLTSDRAKIKEAYDQIDVWTTQKRAEELIALNNKADGLTPIEKKELEKIMHDLFIVERYNSLDRAVLAGEDWLKESEYLLQEFKLSIDPTNGYKGAFTEENYRYYNIDEYFAEMLTDQLLLKHWKKADLAPEGSFTRVIQQIGIFFKDLWISLKAQLGGPRTEKIFNDFLKQRNTKQIREYGLAATPGQIEHQKDLWRQISMEILDHEGPSPIDPRVDELYRNMQERVVDKPKFRDPTPDEVRGVGDEFLENIKKVDEGEINLVDEEIWQDVTAIRSPSGKKVYTETTPDVERLYDAVSHQIDRIIDTGIPVLDTRKIVEQLQNDFLAEGIDLEDFLSDENIKEATAFFANNAENVRNLLTLRIGLDVSSRETAKYARQMLNAEANGSIDYAATAKSLEESLETSLKYVRTYRTWTRAAGQLLASTQAPINAKGINPVNGSLRLDKAGIVEDLNAKVQKDELYQNLPEEYRQAVETGEWTPEAESIAHQLAFIAADSDKAAGMKTLEQFIDGPSPIKKAPKKVDRVERVGKALAVWRVNQLLSASKTWGVQLAVFPRMAVEPLFNAGIEAASGNLRKANLALQQYQFYMRYAEGALRLGGKSLETGMALYDPKRRVGAWAGDMVDLDGYNQNRAYQLKETHPSYDLNQRPILRELKDSPISRFLTIAWKAGTMDIRGMQSLETLQKSLAGNSLLHTIGLEEGLAQAQRKGLPLEEQWKFADRWAAAKVKFYTSDAVVNGETISDAIMKDETAIQIGRILTFTNDVRARVGQRTYGFGAELARARGEVDEAAIDEFALAYRDGKVSNKALQLYNRVARLGEDTKGLKKGETLADVPEVGDLTPSMTAGWSKIPQWWGHVQASRLGFAASFIQPFNRTPGDITKQAIRMIPGLNMTTDTFYRDLLHESGYISNRWKGEVATGTVVLGFLGGAMFNDEFPIEWTGFGPNDPGMRKAWEMAKRPPLSWRHRWKDSNGEWRYGRWHSYRAFEPATTLLAGMADYKMLYADLSQEQRDNAGVALTASLAAQVIQNRFSASYYQGIMGFVNQFSDSGYGRRALEVGERSKFERGVQRFILSFAPRSSQAREIRQAYDPGKKFVPTTQEPIVIDWENGLEKGVDANGLDVYFNSQEDFTGNAASDLLTKFSGFGSQFLDELKNSTPGFSDKLPPRINWITGEPLYNPGFLGSGEMPGEDAPWLFRLTEATWRSMAGGLVSEYGIGGKSEKTDSGFPPSTSKNVIVMEEMLRLSQKGNVFAPPRPTDFGKGIDLSYPAFQQYQSYIYSMKLDEFGGLNLAEALHQVITKDTQYRKLNYINHPIDSKDVQDGYTRKLRLEEVINAYKKAAKEKFRTDVNNPYRMEVLLIEQRRLNNNEQYKLFREGGPHPDQYRQTDNMGQNRNTARQFSSQLNQ